MCESYLEMTHSYVWHDTFVCVTWLIHMRDMTHWYVWHDSLICVTWLIRMRDVTHSYVWHDSFLRVPWLIHTCDMTHSNAWHDSFIRVTWLILTCATTHSYARHDSFICVTYSFRHSNVRDGMSHVLSRMCNMTHSRVNHGILQLHVPFTSASRNESRTHSYVWHDSHSFTCVTWLTLIHKCDVTHAHSHVWRDSSSHSHVKYVTHDSCSFTSVTWLMLIHMWRDSWLMLIHMWSTAFHNSIFHSHTYASSSIHTHTRHLPFTQTHRHASHMSESTPIHVPFTHIRVTHEWVSWGTGVPRWWLGSFAGTKGSCAAI